MRITIKSTSFVTRIDGVLVRLWEGETEDHIPVKVFVKTIAVHKDYDASAFDRELMMVDVPAEMVPLRDILT